MRAPFKLAALFLLSISLSGCTSTFQWMHLTGYERDIKQGTAAIADAHDNAGRAAGYAQRGRAYSEKARYSRAFKLIPMEEYERLFDLAIKDHNQAVALDPGSADAYFHRGETYFDRGRLEEKSGKPWLDRSLADFKKATEINPKHVMAWDLLGVANQDLGQLDDAIIAYTKEEALDKLGQSRLAGAYCERGSANYKDKKYDAAIADYEKSIAQAALPDGCDCDPYGPLAELYRSQGKRFDQSWEVVHRAQQAGRWIAPEFLDSLKKDSGREK